MPGIVRWYVGVWREDLYIAGEWACVCILPNSVWYMYRDAVGTYTLVSRLMHYQGWYLSSHKKQLGNGDSELKNYGWD